MDERPISGRGPRLQGREEITTLLRAFVVGQSDAASMLLAGPDGSGRTALLATAGGYAAAAGTRFVAVRGGDSPAPYGLWREIVETLAPAVQLLPAPHRKVLSEALSGSGASVQARLILATAALNIVRNASRSSPLVISVDDAHRLDPDSADLLAFVARRLAGSGSRLLITSRPGDAVIERAVDTAVSLEPLSAIASQCLLRNVFPYLTTTTRTAIAIAARGNPKSLIDQGYAALMASGASSPQPSEALADLLTRAADRARANGEVRTAATTFARAAELSPRPADQARRFALAACALADVTGDVAAVRRWHHAAAAAGHGRGEGGAPLALVVAD
ncbi:ATP-binding protein, partial [Nocardia sp. NPDC004722]